MSLKVWALKMARIEYGEYIDMSRIRVNVGVILGFRVDDCWLAFTVRGWKDQDIVRLICDGGVGQDLGCRVWGSGFLVRASSFRFHC